MNIDIKHYPGFTFKGLQSSSLPVNDINMKLPNILAATLLAPLLFGLSYAKEEQGTAAGTTKPSLTYYYFDG